jgi:FlaA1/EpsC-like NDP-sugar epimerase
MKFLALFPTMGIWRAKVKSRVNGEGISSFTGKTLLITGGTGTFGNAVLNRFLDSSIDEIRIFSRDEKKQHDMRPEGRFSAQDRTQDRYHPSTRDT